MMGVELIARIRFEHYQNGKASASRATPLPRLGPWVPVLTAILEAEAKLPKRERRSTQRLFEGLKRPAPV